MFDAREGCLSAPTELSADYFESKLSGFDDRLMESANEVKPIDLRLRVI